MNKIVVVNDKTKDIRLSNNIEFHIETYDTLFSITNLSVEITSDEILYLFVNAVDKKYKVNIDISSGVHAKLYIFENINSSKIQYSFLLSEDSNLCVKHFNKNSLSKQMIETNLIGTNSNFNYEIRKICNNKEVSDFYIHHCGDNTVSNLSGDIVSLNGATVSVQLSVFVEDGCKGAVTLQNIKILKFKDGKSDIKPNLYVDNNTATINHNNQVLMINDIVELDFMINNIDDKKLKNEVINFLDRIGGIENE